MAERIRFLAVNSHRIASMKHQARPHKNSPAVIAALLALSVCTAARGDVKITGLNDAQETNVRAFLRLDDLDCTAGAWEIDSLTRTAPAQIRDALEALGHYRATVTITPGKGKGTCWRKLIDVQPGPLTTYALVRVAVEGEGRDNPDIKKLLANTPIKTGAPVHHGRYETFKRRLRSLVAERGFFDAQLSSSEVVVANDKRSAQATLVIDSGRRYRFGAVDFGEPVLDEPIFRRLLALQEGEPYDARKIAATHRNFLESGYFQFVNVVVDPTVAEDFVVPVRIESTAAKARLYSGGVGYATDIGPRFQLNYRNRRINRRGHTLDGKLQLSPAQSLLAMEYRLPFGDDRRDTLSLRTGVAQEDTQTSESKSYEIVLRQTRALDSGWLRSAYVSGRREFYKISDQVSNSTLVVPGIQYSRLTEKTEPRPKKGYRLSVDLRGTSTFLGSDTTFVQLRGDARHIMSLGERTRLLSRASIGATGLDALSELPPSARFFVGGDNSVRGYAYESLGPVDDDGIVIGGANLLVGSLEIDYRLSERWAIAAFADSGSAFNDTDLTFSTGIGVGLRLLTPIGPVRIDVASPLDLERDYRLHISIGSDL